MTDSATSRAERAPLLASGDEGMRASSSGGGWGRFALGAGTLGVIAACAAVATTPASMDAGLKTLGIGLSLPRAERGGAPRTAHHIRPVMGGALDEPKKVLSASLFDDDEETPSLGSHSGRSASKEDDSDRDRQFLVPTTVMDALTEKMNAKTSRHTCVLPRVLPVRPTPSGARFLGTGNTPAFRFFHPSRASRLAPRVSPPALATDVPRAPPFKKT